MTFFIMTFSTGTVMFMPLCELWHALILYPCVETCDYTARRN